MTDNDSPEWGGLTGRVLRSAGQERHYSITFIVFVVVVFFVGLIWYSYPKDGSQKNVPLIRADKSPYKVEPEDPGGMDIPFQDSTIFDTSRDGQTRQERLLPPPEQPIPKDKLFAGLNADVSDEAEEAIVALESQKEVEEPKVVEKVLTELKEEKPAPQTKPLQIKQEAKPAPVEIKPTLSGDYRVQLGSLGSQSDAESEWKRLQGMFSELKPLKLTVQKADLGAKGIYYRVQAGPLNKAEAQTLCQVIVKKRPGGCLVVHR